MTWKKNYFKWGPKQQQTFEQIKWEIVHATAPRPVWAGQNVKMCSILHPGQMALPAVSGKRPQSISSLLFRNWGYRVSEASYTPGERDTGV